jgi:hypothetical protein
LIAAHQRVANALQAKRAARDAGKKQWVESGAPITDPRKRTCRNDRFAHSGRFDPHEYSGDDAIVRDGVRLTRTGAPGLADTIASASRPSRSPLRGCLRQGPDGPPLTAAPSDACWPRGPVSANSALAARCPLQSGPPNSRHTLHALPCWRKSSVDVPCSAACLQASGTERAADVCVRHTRDAC